MEVLESMSSPQLTRYSRSFTLAVCAASLRFYSTPLENLSLPTVSGASAVAAEAGSEPLRTNNLEDLKSPK